MTATDGVAELNETPTPPAFSSLSDAGDLDAWLAARGLTLRMEPTACDLAFLEMQRELARQICAVFGIAALDEARAKPR